MKQEHQIQVTQGVRCDIFVKPRTQSNNPYTPVESESHQRSKEE